MKKTSIRLFGILVVILLAGHLIYLEFNKSSNLPGVVYDEPRKADRPEFYLSLMDELTTRPGKDFPDYPVGYKFTELANARRNLSSLRLEETYEFIERGPANVPGRTRGLIGDPDDPTQQTWFAGGVGGGIWQTTDAGLSWQDKTTDIPNVSISCIVMAESNHDVLYAGTGEGWSGSSNFIKGNGILKSEDHGESWYALSSTTNNTEFEIVNRLIVDPNDENIILAATSTDRRFNLDRQSGIYKSTDGGETWTKKYSSESFVQQIIADPSDFSIQYATESGIGVIKSTDAGETWLGSSNGMVVSRRVEMAISPVNTNRLYASAQGDISGSGSDLYYSDDAGESWHIAVNETGTVIDFLGGQGWYDNTILAHPFIKDEVYVGGVDFWKFKVSNQSIDLGNKFSGADEEGLGNFFTLLPFNSGEVYDDKIVLGDQSDEEFVSVEIRFGPDGEGGMLQQMAHRFTVPDGRGSGVDDADYSYQDYVEVPFQVWDIDNNRQLMVSFRDQQQDEIFNLLELNTENDEWQINSREYLYIHNVDYSPTTPDPSIATDGGHVFNYFYFMWPYLPADQTWDPASFPPAIFRIRFQNVSGTSTEFIPVADSYERYGGPNSFSQTTGSTSVEGVHPDHHNIVPIIHSETERTFQLLLANDGGIYSSNISSDPGVEDDNWTFAGTGYNTAQFYAVDKAPGESRYVGGLQDNGTWMSIPGQDGNETARYRRVNGGDGFGTVWNYADKSQILSTVYFNSIYKSLNEGASSFSSTQGLTDVGGNLGPFVTELEYYHADPDVVYTVGASGVWKSENFGDSWSLAAIDTDWRLYFTMFASISLANPNIVWAGTGMSSSLDISFHVSTDAGESFLPTTKFDGDLGRASGFATHPYLDSTAFALFSYAKSPKILRTDNLGETWYDISGFESGTSSSGFPDVSVRDLLVMPNDTSVFWAATEIGVFESTDAGDSWHMLPGNLPAIPVWDIKIVDKEVVLGSHGRGIWSIELEELTGHVYLPEITAAIPSINGEPTFVIKALSDYDSAILYLNDQRVNKADSITAFSFIDLPATGIFEQTGNAYVRAYRDGRPFVSKRFDYSLFEYADVVDSYDNDFESGFSTDFVGQGFNISSYDGLPGMAIQSVHYYESNEQYYFVLKNPIRVREFDAYINLTEIVLVQPGEQGALPGSPEFKDYVAIQASKDGINWTNLLEPYDASARTKWQSGFGPIALPRPDMIFFRAIDLQEKFETGDEIIIRFILRSNDFIEGWGWMIDNLRIQTESVIADLDEGLTDISFEVYPNPVTEDKVMLTSPVNSGTIDVKLINLKGQVSYQKRINLNENNELKLSSDMENGVYIMQITTPAGKETHKLIINR